ncbi:MAG: hypothetical protein QOD84_18 [Acidobacteriaceae bacterium]|jgi:hypothetical protein
MYMTRVSAAMHAESRSARPHDSQEENANRGSNVFIHEVGYSPARNNVQNYLISGQRIILSYVYKIPAKNLYIIWLRKLGNRLHYYFRGTPVVTSNAVTSAAFLDLNGIGKCFAALFAKDVADSLFHHVAANL